MAEQNDSINYPLNFEFLADSLPQLVWVTEPDGNHCYFNQRWYEYTGLTFEQSRDQGWPQALHAEDFERTLSIWQRSLESGAPYQVQYRLRRYDGTYRWFSGQALPRRDSQGNVVNWYGTGTDIEEQKRSGQRRPESQQRERDAPTPAERQKARLERFFAQASAAICVLDSPQLVFELVNPAFQQLYPGRALLGKPLLEALPEIGGRPCYSVLEQVYRTGQPFEGGEVLFPLAGREGNALEEAYFDFRCQPRLDEKGQVDGILVFGYPVTDQVLARRTLEENQARLQAIIQATPECIKIVSPDGTLQFMNASGLGMIEGETELLGNACVFGLIAPEHLSTWIQNHERVCAGESLSWEFDMIGLHGTRRRMETHAVPLASTAGTAQLAVTRDITRRKQAEEALREAHARTMEILESTTDAFYALDADFNFTYINQRAAGLWGRDRDSLLGRHYWTEFPNAVGSHPYHKHYQARKEGVPVHFETVSPLVGIWIDVSIYPGSNESLSVFFRDITGRKKAEAQLRESEAQFRLFVQASSDLVYKMSSDWQQMYFLESKSFLADTRGASSTWVEQYIPLSDQPQVLGAIAAAIDGKRNFELEHRVIRADGSTGWTFSRAIPVLNEQGEIKEWFGTASDITDRKRAEFALRESEARFRQMVDAVPISMWITDAEGSVEYLNKHWCDYCGVAFNPTTADEIGVRFLHPEDAPKVMEVFGKAMQTGSPWEVEQRNRSAGGEYRWFLNRAQPYRDPKTGQVTKWFGVGIDIHERKRAEQQRQQMAQELAAANQDLRAANGEIQAANAELAATNERLNYINADLDNFVYTASHDLKAPILNIEGLLKALERELGKDRPQAGQVQQLYGFLYGSVDRFKATIRELTDVARISKESAEDVACIPLAAVLEEVILDLQTHIQESAARLEVKLEGEEVRFSRKNLKSILYNLLSNALKYCSPERQPLIRITCQVQPEHLLLKVEDNGLGMDVRQQEKIFGLFKRLHTHVEGTGIGLYIVKKMVENAGGKIEVASQKGVGSTFKVYFKR